MIRVVEEPKDLCRKWGFGRVYENCCFCKKETTFWCEERDVACCSTCAKMYSLEDVPSKEEWCKAIPA